MHRKLFSEHSWSQLSRLLIIFIGYYLTELFVQIKYLICDLSSCSHWLFSDFLKNWPTKEDKFFVFLLAILAIDLFRFCILFLILLSLAYFILIILFYINVFNFKLNSVG